MKLILAFFALIMAPYLAQAATYSTDSVEMKFLMDAPVEKIKGSTNQGSGKIDVDDEDFTKLQGSFSIDLATIKLNTFSDPEKDAAQTDHMINWFEIGDEVSPETKAKFKNAVLKINSVAKVEKISEQESKVIVVADLTLHGITKSKTIDLSVTKKDGGYTVKTLKPFLINLGEHDVKPRDIAGKLVQKTLESLGQKVARDAQVEISVSLKK